MFYPMSANRLIYFTLLVISLFFFSVTTEAQTYTLSACSGSTFSFVQPGALTGTTYTWSAPVISPGPGDISNGSAVSSPQNIISQTLYNNTASPATATYLVTTSNSTSFLLRVTVNPAPTLSSSSTPPSVCSGTSFFYQPLSATAGTNFNWSRPAVAGVTNATNQGTGNPNEILMNTTALPVNVTYNYTLIANGCSNNQTVIVTVNPTPGLTSQTNPASICSGTFFNYTPASNIGNTSFNWTRAAVGGISAGAGSGTGAISEQLDNTVLFPVPVGYTYRITDNSTGCNNMQNISVTVNPAPSVPDQAAASCSNNTFMISPSPTPTGTRYTWLAPVISPAGTITGGAAVTVGQNYIGQALTNNSGTTATAQYTVTPDTYGCSGSPFQVTVSVSPSNSKAVLSSTSTPPDICSGTPFNYHPVTGTAGTSFAWRRYYTPGISTNAAVGTGDINEILTNTSNQPITVFYVYTLTANGCSNTQDIAVIVNPATSLSSSLLPPAICSNTTFSYVPNSSNFTTFFNWTRVAVAGISNAAASGTGNPNETLINTTNLPVSVTYNYALVTTNGCINNQNVTVQVNPIPTLSSTLAPPAICSGTTFNYTPLSPVAGALFTWSRALVPNIGNGAGNGTFNPTETLVNTSNLVVNVPYSFTVSANGCSDTKTVTVSVNPVPNIINQVIATCSNTAFTVAPANVPANTKYTWTFPSSNPAGTITGGAAQAVPQNNISQTLVNSTINPAIATYTVTPNANGCTGASFTVAATINPVPAVANQLLTAMCSGNTFNYTPAGTPAGTTYTWSNPLQAPVNGLTGGSAQPVSQVSISQPLSSVNNIMDTAIYTVTPATNGCAGNTFTVTVPVKPVPVINNINDTICSGTPFSVMPSPVPANTTYTWATPVNFPFGSVINGTQQNTPAASISQVLTNTTNATAQTVYTVNPVSGGCAGTPFTLTMTVGVPLPFIANQSTIICSGTTFNATPATAPPGTTYTWSIPVVTPAGSVLGLSAAATPQSIISQMLTNLLNINDTVVYAVRPYNTGCQGNIFTATVRVLPSPKAVVTGQPVICAYPRDTMSIAFTGNAPWSFDYTDNTGALRSVTGITNTPYTWIAASVPGVSNQTYAITRVKDLACTNLTDTFYFSQKLNPLPVARVNSLHGIYICNNTPDTLTISSLPTDTLTYQWLLNGVAIPGAVTDSLATAQPGNYNVRLVNQFGCVDTAGASLGLILVNKPVLNFTYDSYCINKPIQFTNLTDTTFTGAIQWTWDLGDSTTANTYHATDTYLTGGDRHIRLIARQLNCASYLMALDSTINIQFPIDAVRLPSVSAYKGVPTPVSGRTIPGYRYLWNPTRGIVNPDSANTIFNHSQTQQYLVNLISPGGCMTPDTMMIRVFDNKMVDILVPKSFTPNGDGVNDILYPYHIGLKEFHYFKVYNRYGQLMFETRNPDIGWNGSFGGTPQPMSIYIWVTEGVALDGSVVRKTGETLLLR